LSHFGEINDDDDDDDDVWNSLPNSVISSSLSSFKRSINCIDFSILKKCNGNNIVSLCIDS